MRIVGNPANWMALEMFRKDGDESDLLKTYKS